MIKSSAVARAMGLKGGVARAEKLSPARRAEIARMGGEAKAKKRKEREWRVSK